MNKLLMTLVLAVTIGGALATAEVVVVSTPEIHGNDTASSLYLRPLNNAALGPAYFGSGYPVSRSSVIYVVPSEVSGIRAATNYLNASGWNSWQAERRNLLLERAELVERIRLLESRVAELERRVESGAR